MTVGFLGCRLLNKSSSEDELHVVAVTVMRWTLLELSRDPIGCNVPTLESKIVLFKSNGDDEVYEFSLGRLEVIDLIHVHDEY